jgi:RNA polymerase sigma-70 factor (ECF subfamily)
VAPRDEDALLARARAGDRSAIERLLEAHETQIYRFGLRMCGDEESAKEVLQETLVAAFRNLPTFRGEAALSTWLYQIARSFCLKERRGERPTVPLDDHLGEGEAQAADGARPDAQAHAREVGMALAAAISALTPAYREALVLRDVEGLSAEEAAEVVGIEVGALKSRLHRARLEVRQHLAAVLGDDSDTAGPEPCSGLVDELGAYVSADIDQAACARLEEHLARCPHCRGACESLQRSVSLCQALPGGEVPASVRAAIRRALTSLTAS